MSDRGRPNGWLVAAALSVGAVAMALVFAAGESSAPTTTVAPAPLAAATTAPSSTPPSTVFPPSTSLITSPSPQAAVDAAPGWRAIPGGPVEPRYGTSTFWTPAGLLVWGGGSADREASGASTLYHRQIGRNPWSTLPDAPLAGGKGSLLIQNSTGVLALSKTGAAKYDPESQRWLGLPETPLAQPLAGDWTGVETIVIGFEAPAPGSSRLVAVAFGPDGGCCRRLPDPPIDLTTASAFWTGDRLLLIGGHYEVSTNRPLDDRPAFASYDPVSDRWTVLPSPDLAGVQALAAGWNGTELIVWDALTDAAAWHPDRGWRSLPDLPFDPLECYPEGVATGNRTFALSCARAAYFDVAADRWVEMWVPPWDSVTSGDCSSAASAEERIDVYLWCVPLAGGDPELWAIDLDAVETIRVSRPASDSPWELVPHPEWSDRDWASLVWADRELIVWGGSDGAEEVRDGWAYQPSTGMMHRIPESSEPGGRVGQSAVWTGELMAVWRGAVNTWDPNRIEWSGGQAPAGPPLHPGNTALWTGEEILFWGTRNWHGSSERGAGFDLDEWRELPASPLEPRSDAAVAWSGDGRFVRANDAMYVWGGFITGGPTGIQAAQDGAAYSPGDDMWRLLPPLPDGIHLEHPVGGFAAGEFIVVGVDRRRNGDTPVVAGAAYDPTTETWRTIADLPGPVVEGGGLGSMSAVTAGDRLAVWLPQTYFGATPGLGLYDPITDTWIRHDGAPADAYAPPLVWTGTEVAALAPAGLVLFTP